MNKVRIAIVGVGNCASSLVQGLEFYKEADPSEKVPGLMHVELGGYHVRDVEVVAAFDVDGKKVGTDVADAIFTEPNNTIRFAEARLVDWSGPVSGLCTTARCWSSATLPSASTLTRNTTKNPPSPLLTRPSTAPPFIASVTPWLVAVSTRPVLPALVLNV